MGNAGWRESRPLPSRYYVVGDEIRLEVEVRHRTNIEELRVVFERDYHPGGTITLIDAPDSTEVRETMGGQGPDVKVSTALLVASVDVDHAPGYYYPSHVVVRDAGGKTSVRELDLEDDAVASAAFVVVPPPDDPMEVTLSFEDQWIGYETHEGGEEAG